jgi:hypothetical protein
VENLEMAEAILDAVPKRLEFLNQFRAQTAEARQIVPEVFVKGSPEHKAAQAWQRKLLNFHALPDQTVILAKLVKLERMEKEEREGVAKYPRVPIEKAASKPATAVKPAALSKAVPAVRPTSGASTNSIAERLNRPGEAIDAEELMNV